MFGAQNTFPQGKGVFQMFGLGPTELVIILIIALVIFGPSRLPKVGQSIGQALRAFRESTDKVQQEVSKSLEETNSSTEEHKE
jgi:TatA/E family protein of Tat protein translocase